MIVPVEKSLANPMDKPATPVVVGVMSNSTTFESLRRGRLS